MQSSSSLVIIRANQFSSLSCILSLHPCPSVLSVVPLLRYTLQQRLKKILSAEMPSACPAKLKMIRCRRVGGQCATFGRDLGAAGRRVADLCAENDRLRRPRAGPVADELPDGLGGPWAAGMRGRHQRHDPASQRRGDWHAAGDLPHFEQPPAVDTRGSTGGGSPSVVRSRIASISSRSAAGRAA